MYGLTPHGTMLFPMIVSMTLRNIARGTCKANRFNELQNPYRVTMIAPSFHFSSLSIAILLIFPPATLSGPSDTQISRGRAEKGQESLILPTITPKRPPKGCDELRRVAVSCGELRRVGDLTRQPSMYIYAHVCMYVCMYVWGTWRWEPCMVLLPTPG